MLEQEAKLGSQERKELFGMEKERSKEMLDAELKYVGELADKNVDLFNKYYDNLAKKRQQLLAQGLTKEEISDFFDTLLASRGQFARTASKIPETYYGAGAYGSLGDARSARISSMPMAISPYNPAGFLRRAESGGLGKAFKNFAVSLAEERQYQKKKAEKKAKSSGGVQGLRDERDVGTQTKPKDKSKSRSRSRSTTEGFVEIPNYPTEVKPSRGRTMETRATSTSGSEVSTQFIAPDDLRRMNKSSLKTYGEERYGILFKKSDKKDVMINKILEQTTEKKK